MMELKSIVKSKKSLGEKLRDTWYLDTVIEKLIFIFGGVSVLYLIIKLIWGFVKG